MIEALKQQVRKLETDLIRLESVKTVVEKHPEYGTFEYIGQPQPLRAPQQDEARNVGEVIERMEAWVKANDRVTVGGIFRSLDRGRFGELRAEDFARAFRRIGIEVTSSSLEKLQRVLDPRSTGYFKYGPIVKQLTGMPAIEFINSKVLTIANFVVKQDLLKEELVEMLDERRKGKLAQQDFKVALQTLLASAGGQQQRRG